MRLPPNILLVLILLSISTISTAGPLIDLENRMLNGNVYAIILNGENDILVFRDGSFQSNLYAGRGYDEGEYTTVTKGNSLWFEAKTVAPIRGNSFGQVLLRGML